MKPKPYWETYYSKGHHKLKEFDMPTEHVPVKEILEEEDERFENGKPHSHQFDHIEIIEDHWNESREICWSPEGAKEDSEDY